MNKPKSSQQQLIERIYDPTVTDIQIAVFATYVGLTGLTHQTRIKSLGMSFELQVTSALSTIRMASKAKRADRDASVRLASALTFIAALLDTDKDNQSFDSDDDFCVAFDVELEKQWADLLEKSAQFFIPATEDKDHSDDVNVTSHAE